MGERDKQVRGQGDKNRLLAEVGKRVRGKGERANKNPFPFNLFPFPPLGKVTFARGLIHRKNLQ